MNKLDLLSKFKHRHTLKTFQILDVIISPKRPALTNLAHFEKEVNDCKLSRKSMDFGTKKIR